MYVCMYLYLPTWTPNYRVLKYFTYSIHPCMYVVSRSQQGSFSKKSGGYPVAGPVLLNLPNPRMCFA